MKGHLNVHVNATKVACIVISALVFIGFGAAPNKPANIRILPTDSSDFPAEISQKGQVVETVRFVDKAGEHIIAICELEQGQLYDQDYKSELFAAQYLITTDEIKREWKIWDFAQTPGSTVSYEEKTLQIEDVDGDGFAESSFFYIIASDGADPWTLKLMLHSKGKKLPIRGKIPLFAYDKQRYEKNIDDSFNAVNIKMKIYASERWEKHVNEKHGGFRRKGN